MTRTTTKAQGNDAAVLVPRPSFGDGNWYGLDELLSYETKLLAVRRGNKTFSDAVRVSTSPEEKLRRDELIPFLDLARHEQLASGTRFRKPRIDLGIDLDFEVGGAISHLQITTAYPALFDKKGKPLNGGHQRRLRMEKLTAEGMLLGSGPFERRGNEIWHHDGCTSWDEIETSCRLGLVKAFKLKSLRGSVDVTLLVKAKGYYEDIFDSDRFHAIVNAAAAEALPGKFSRVVVVDYGPGFIWSRMHQDNSFDG